MRRLDRLSLWVCALVLGCGDEALRYEGQSEVEPLIPLQDELNTRLSDRANRVTMQSFKMYLAKGLDGFADGSAPVVGPGRVWTTDNPDASMQTFGGDSSSPSVTPIASSR